MRVAIVGGGLSGLVTAKVLDGLGLEIAVYEKADDIGGVWGASRRYAGIRTQNDKRTYSLSDMPMPSHYPEWPTGEQVQEYLEQYARRFGLQRVLRLGREVTAAQVLPDASGWRVVSDGEGGEDEDVFDHLVVANGTFHQPFVPDFPELGDFEAAGGRVLAAHELQDVGDARGRHVAVVGYGKSACDVAVAVSGVAAGTAVIARHLTWKMPRRVGGLINYKYLMLTRLGEALFPYLEPRPSRRLLRRAANAGRGAVLRSLQAVVTTQGRLRPAGLVPMGAFADIARSTVSLTSDGFYEAVRRGRISVRRDTHVTRLRAIDGRPHVELADGSALPADLLVCGTGHRQEVPFLDPEVCALLQDERGNFRLHHQVQPLSVPALSFVGYNSSFFSPLSSEVAALWVGAYLLGERPLPDPATADRAIDERLAWMEAFTEGRHARGTNVIPFSMHNIDSLLDDLGLNIGLLGRARQWLLPVDPSVYQTAERRLRERARGAHAPSRRAASA